MKNITFCLKIERIQAPIAATKVMHHKYLPLPLTTFEQREVPILSFTHAVSRTQFVNGVIVLAVTQVNRNPWRHLMTHYNFWMYLCSGLCILNYLSCWPVLSTDSPCCTLDHSMEHKRVQRSVKQSKTQVGIPTVFPWPVRWQIFNQS